MVIIIIITEPVVNINFKSLRSLKAEATKNIWKKKGKWQQKSTAGSTSGGDGESASGVNEERKLNMDF